MKIAQELSVFNGVLFAEVKERTLAMEVADLALQGVTVAITAVLFDEDAGSTLYTRLKQEAAERVGISYQVLHCSLTEPIPTLQQKISSAGADPKVTGVIIQKPYRSTWQQYQTQVTGEQPTSDAYTSWWRSLTEVLPAGKDVDGLRQDVISQLSSGQTPEVLPATVAAIELILAEAYKDVTPRTESLVSKASMVILGRSDIVGLPLFWHQKQLGVSVALWGRAELQNWREQHPDQPLPGQVIVSATGKEKVLSWRDFAPGSVVIDVGEPKPDVDPQDLRKRVRFHSPVPGGVGPVTISCLLANGVVLAKNQHHMI